MVTQTAERMRVPACCNVLQRFAIERDHENRLGFYLIPAAWGRTFCMTMHYATNTACSNYIGFFTTSENGVAHDPLWVVPALLHGRSLRTVFVILLGLPSLRSQSASSVMCGSTTVRITIAKNGLHRPPCDFFILSSSPWGN